MSEDAQGFIPPPKKKGKKKKKVKKTTLPGDGGQVAASPLAVEDDSSVEESAEESLDAANTELDPEDVFVILDLDQLLIGTVNDLLEQLLYLHQHPQAKVVEFSDGLAMDGTLAKPLIDHFVARGLVVRKWVAGAGRYSLTDRGEKVLSMELKALADEVGSK